MTREMTVYDGETGEIVNKRRFDSDEECYQWYHDNYDDEVNYPYEKLG